MTKYVGSVLFIDNDSLVEIFYNLFNVNKSHFYEVVAVLSSRYDNIWIAGTVEWEYGFKRSEPKRMRNLENHLRDISILMKCPIKVAKKEIVSVIGNTEKNAGETDVLIQMNKAVAFDHYEISELTFLSRDAKALTMFKYNGYETLPYNELSAQMMETGIIMP